MYMRLRILGFIRRNFWFWVILTVTSRHEVRAEENLPSLDPSIAVSPLPSISLIPSSSLIPSLLPSISKTPSTGPSSAPRNTPSVSVRPTQSAKPSSPPSDAPSSTPTASSRPTISLQPSHAPTLLPSDVPSALPSISMVPSDAPSDVPSNVPSQFPSPSPTTTFRPSVEPTLSQAPSEQPSDMPSTNPSTGPTDLPSESPSQIPSSSPSLTKTNITSMRLQMAISGLESNFVDQSQITAWEMATSHHVRMTWNNVTDGPFEVGLVGTSFLSQQRISTSNNDQRTRLRHLQRETVNLSQPLLISYAQWINFAIDDEFLASNYMVPADVFTKPFVIDQLPYAETVEAIMGNSRSIVVTSVAIVPEPTTAPAPAPDNSDRRLIITVVAVVGMALLLAGGYLYYLLRKAEEEDEDVVEGTVVSFTEAPLRTSSQHPIDVVSASTEVLPPTSSLHTRQTSLMTSDKGGDDPTGTDFPPTVVAVSPSLDVIDDPMNLMTENDAENHSRGEFSGDMESSESDEAPEVAMADFQMQIQELDD